MLTGSAGKPRGTTPSTRMAVGRSSPSRCTATSEVGQREGMGGSLCPVPPGTSSRLCTGARAGWRDGDTPGGWS